MHYLLLKALHVVGFVSWFAGLFYVVRLFIYIVEAAERPPAERAVLEAQLGLMARRLWFAITVPAMVLTVACGGALAVLYVRGAESFAAVPWLHAKLALIAALLVYHHQCGRVRRQLAAGTCRWTSARLRLWNEVATLLLVAIVMVAVFKSLFDALWGTLGLVVFGIALGVAVKRARARRARYRAP
jgi:putative membrane protein